MTLTILGSGTSHGVPVIACSCAVCSSSDGHDKRLRASAFLESNSGGKTTHVLIDVGPDFRMQALRQKIPALDAVLITHGHADHLHGLDDIRIFSHTKTRDKAASETPMPIFANKSTQKIIRTHFDYIFMRTQMGGGKPLVELKRAERMTEKNPLKIGGMEIISVPMKHGIVDVSGYLISESSADGKKRSIAYLTDCNSIPDSSAALILRNCGTLEHLVIDGLRKESHTTHFSFSEALAFAEKIRPRHTWTTHMTHNTGHEELKKYLIEILPQFPALEKIVASGGSVAPAYDGLVLSAAC